MTSFMINEAARWRNLRHGGGVSDLVSRRHGQSNQLSHGHLQQAAAGRLGLRGKQSLGKGRKNRYSYSYHLLFVRDSQSEDLQGAKTALFPTEDEVRGYKDLV